MRSVAVRTGSVAATLLIADSARLHCELAAAIEASRELVRRSWEVCLSTYPRIRPISGGSSDDAAIVVTMITDVSLCLECIAKKSGLPLTRIGALLTTIAANIALVVETGRCDACLETMTTVRLDSHRPGIDEATRPRVTRDAILRFLRQHPDRAFCADCISTTIFAGKNIDVAMRHLEGNGVHRWHARCSACAKLRLVAGLPSSN
jgi:hypothetical protein